MKQICTKKGRTPVLVAGSLLAAVSLAYAAAPMNVMSGVYSFSQASQGEEVFTQSCAVCHGANLTGRDVAPPLAGDAFLQRWSGRKLIDLYDLVLNTMPKQHPNSLSPEDCAAVVAYLLQANGYPSGDTALPSEATKLASVEMVLPVAQ